ncbi:hypothetical protein [Variovorax paradoxus]|uniref:hypothetical protein n=1 Tax=Variovorax paradoxus TaxID=34073 RepID=UPI00277EFE12|nr:hypothetical protein [Variovorax paradoxus]MDQ0586634.1 hypothetical protein [Variovorax paradoxus]
MLTAQRAGVPAWLLFGIALQESQLAFGKATVPFPWTLCVRGRGERHNSYQAVRDALQGYLRAGVTNVDCGAMQVTGTGISVERISGFADAVHRRHA